MIELRQRKGTQQHQGRSVEVTRPIDDVYDVTPEKAWNVGWSQRNPPGSPLLLFAPLSESQIKEACRLLDERDGGEYPNRKVSNPPPLDDQEDDG